MLPSNINKTKNENVWKNYMYQRRTVVIDFKVVDCFYNEYWHETFRSDYDYCSDTSIRDLQEHALLQYMWELKKETINELHTKKGG